jgi:hypothetical protein
METGVMEMSKSKLFNFEIDVSDAECDRFDCFASYGTIVAEGNTLEELLENASVDVIDQDGGDLDNGPADAKWMQDLIEAKFNDLGPDAIREARLAVEGERQLDDHFDMEHSRVNEDEGDR